MILLTGASGYLGRHVQQVMRAKAIPQMALSREEWDCAKESDVREVLAAYKPDVVIHCAARVPKHAEQYHDKRMADDSLAAAIPVLRWATCPIVLASSMTAALRDSEYAKSKATAEVLLAYYGRRGSVTMRLPGLFGLPRRSGVIYEACQIGHIPVSFGPYPAMHVQDAAEYLVRAATQPSDGLREPFSVTYGDPRLERVYGSLGVTFDQRVREFVAEAQRERVQA